MAYVDSEYKWNKYDWDEWLDGQTWVFVEGEDFDIQPSSFRSSAAAAAKSRGLKVMTGIDDEGNVRIKATGPAGGGLRFEDGEVAELSEMTETNDDTVAERVAELVIEEADEFETSDSDSF